MEKQHRDLIAQDTMLFYIHYIILYSLYTHSMSARLKR